MPTHVSPIAKALRHLEAGNWQSAHDLVQKDSSSLGCWAHGIVHLVEGDLPNARYWYRRAHRTLPHGDNAAAEISALRDSLGQNLATKRIARRDTPAKVAPPGMDKARSNKGTQ